MAKGRSRASGFRFKGFKGLGVLLLLALLYAIEQYGGAAGQQDAAPKDFRESVAQAEPRQHDRRKTGDPPASRVDAGAAERAFRDGRSDVQLTARGIVDRTLADDNQGSRHQRFLLRLESGHTVLVSHNIDLAARIESLRVGDPVEVHGEFEWNERGGVIHWTHRDPDGRHPGGWIEHEGRRYR